MVRALFIRFKQGVGNFIDIYHNMISSIGHIHDKNIADPLYFNVSVENIDYTPMPLYLVKERLIAQQALYQQATNIVLDLI